MFTIAETSSKTLSDALRTLDDDALEDCCTDRIFQRGEEYYSDGAITSFRYLDDFNAKLSVSGSEKYEVLIRLRKKEILATCDCPYTSEYGDVCKHIVAALLSARKTSNSSIKEAAVSVGDEHLIFTRYLESLSQNELMKLVEEFASADFRRTVVRRMTRQYAVPKTPKEIRTKLRKIINSMEFENISNYLQSTAELLNDAREMWTQSPAFITEMIVEILTAFDSKLEEEDPYDGYYESEYAFDISLLEDTVSDFISLLDTAEKFETIRQLSMATMDHSFDTFGNFPADIDTLYTDNEVPALKNLVFSALDAGNFTKIREYYTFLRPTLTDAECENILLKIANDGRLTLELVRLRQKMGKFKEAVDVLEKYFSTEKKNIEYIELRLELARNLGEAPDKIATICRNTFNDTPANTILKASIHALPEIALEFEEILRKKSPNQYFLYLEGEGRLDECIQLLSEKPEGFMSFKATKTDFFKRHRKEFPAEAEYEIILEIEANLHSADDYYYNIIAKNLGFLLEINRQAAQEMYRILKTEYKRRRNLMKMIDDVFSGK